MSESEERLPRCGMCALVGCANVGKSTLLNRMLEEKVSIVSPVAQTTRNMIRGILTEPRGQLVFLDTPGVHQASYDLGRLMNRRAREAVEGVDAVLLLFDTTRPPRLEDEGWMRRLARSAEPFRLFGLLNKADTGAPHAEAYRALWDRISAEGAAGQEGVVACPTPRPMVWFSVSALEGIGVNELLEALFESAPEQPYLFPPEVLTDFPRKLAIGDVLREKFFLRLQQEVPHRLAVEVEAIDEASDTMTVRASVFVERESQKGIVIGHKGRMLRAARRAAEAELQALYERPVKLDLSVKVEKNWTRNFWFLKRLGYA